MEAWDVDLLIKQVLNPTEWTESHSSTLKVCSFSDISLLFKSIQWQTTGIFVIAVKHSKLPLSLSLSFIKGKKRRNAIWQIAGKKLLKFGMIQQLVWSDLKSCRAKY